jgi:hypothetical protein
MKRFLPLLLAATALAGFPAAAQNVPEIPFDSAANALTTPDDVYLGEASGVATDSKGNIYVYNRTGHPTMSLGGARYFAHGGSKMYQFDRNGKYVREIGHDLYGFMFAKQVRVDKDDNIWAVDQMTNMVIKFDNQGRQVMLLGRKAEGTNVPTPPPPAAGPPGVQGAPIGSGRPQDLFDRPTDIAWDAQGNIFVADGQGNARVAKFTKDGVFVKSWGSRGNADGQFKTAHAIAVDASGNVYVGYRGNNRIQVFDNDGNFKSSITTGGDPEAICISPGAHQYLYSSNSNPQNDLDHGGEIYKLELNGTVVGKFGQAGKGPRDFGSVNAIDCRNANALYVAEAGNWRVTKVTLR